MFKDRNFSRTNHNFKTYLRVKLTGQENFYHYNRHIAENGNKAYNNSRSYDYVPLPLQRYRDSPSATVTHRYGPFTTVTKRY